MSNHRTHAEHQHVHGTNCGHVAVRHGGHVDYLHDGHLHAVHGDHVDECIIPIDMTNPDDCTEGHACAGHTPGHIHREGCGHPEVPHGDHVDYLVDDHLPHMHDGHCDDHGPLGPA